MRKIQASRVSTFLPGIVAAVFCLLLVVAGIVYATSAEAISEKITGKRMVTIHDHGKDRGVLTRATTLREVLKEADIPLDVHDKVEPGLDEPLVARNYDVNIYRARPVVVVDGSIRQKVMTADRTPKQIAAAAGIELHDEDTASFARSSGMVAEGAAVTMSIDRATPFTLVLYGKKIQAYTQATTVGQMLVSKDIHLAEEDTLSVKKNAPLVAGMTVELWRNGKQTVNREEVVKFEVRQVEDPNRAVGYRKITTPGVNGEKNVTYEIIMKNGKEVSRKEIQSVVTKKPQEQVEVIGTKNSYSGSLNDWLYALRMCESGGNYSTNTGNGFYGAYQFMDSTWDSLNTGYDRADLAPQHVQDQAIIDNTNRTAGLRTQNPGCYASTGISNKPPAS